jgi:hypothetical protein
LTPLISAPSAPLMGVIWIWLIVGILGDGSMVW